MELVVPAIADVYPLSPPQLAVFNRDQRDSSPVPIQQIVFQVEGLNNDFFERAWQRLVEHHPAFRTSIQWENLDRPVQVVHGDVKFGLERLDWSTIPVEEHRNALVQFLAEDRQRGIDLEHPPLFRVSVVQLTEASALFVWSYHPIVLDPWSTALVLDDLNLLYEALCKEKAFLLLPSPRYREFITWLRVQDPDRAEDYWRRLLSDVTNPTPLPLSQKNSEKGFQDHRLAVGQKLTTKIRAFAAQHDLKVSTLVRGAWAVVLGCHSGAQEVVFGEVCSGRPAAIKGIQRTVGLFANILPMRVTMPKREDLLLWLRGLEEAELQHRPYQHNLLSQIVTWSNLPSKSPLFESVLNLEKWPTSNKLRSSTAGELQTQPIRTEATRPIHPLVITVSPSSKDGLIMKGTTLKCRFQPGVGDHLLKDFRTVLSRLVADPQPRLDDLQRVVSPLISLQTQGSQSPLFFVHPAGGSVLGYLQLAEALGSDQPFFAFEARGSEKRHHIRIQTVAAYYLAALLRAYPNGPYRLGGWSFGGVVAFEMAQQLRQRGQHVIQLTLLDPPLTFKKKPNQAGSRKSSPLIHFARRHGLPLKESTLTRVPEPRRIAFVLKRFKKAELLPPQTTVPEFQRQVQLFLYHSEAVKSYLPQSYPDRVTLLLAEERKEDTETQSADDWTSLTPHLEVHRIPGSHQTMMRHPQVVVLAEKIQCSFRD